MGKQIVGRASMKQPSRMHQICIKHAFGKQQGSVGRFMNLYDMGIIIIDDIIWEYIMNDKVLEFFRINYHNHS